MRTFEKTHPWISFRFNLSQAHPELWLGLGEAASKCEHIAKVPLRPATAQRLHELFLAKGVAATTAIEGNTLTEEEVLKAVEGRLEVPPSKEYLKQEVDNVIGACNAITQQLVTGTLPLLNREVVCGYNRQILTGLPAADEKRPGELRTHSVIVGTKYRGAPAEDCPYLMDRLCEWLNGPDFVAPKGMEVAIAIVKAVVAHLYLAWIHPFGDGNGRTARLLEFHILLSAGVPSPAAHLLSNHYNQTRTEYYRQLDLASKSGGDILPFIRYAVQGMVDGLRSQLEVIWGQQWDVTWRNYVHELFPQYPNSSNSHARQRLLALELGSHDGWVEISKLMELSKEIMLSYFRKHPKTLQRDLASLESMGLIERSPQRMVRAKREVILQFLPVRKG